MSTTGTFFDKRILRNDRDSTITARCDYIPVDGVSPTDSSTQLATTQFVANYSNPIISLAQTNGTIALSENKFYKITLSGSASFSLPTPKDLSVRNIIKVYLRQNASNLNINWGTASYLGGNAPLKYVGNYILYYVWNPLAGVWTVGALTEGKLY